jgi:hypothetical protein
MDFVWLHVVLRRSMSFYVCTHHFANVLYTNFSFWTIVASQPGLGDKLVQVQLE